VGTIVNPVIWADVPDPSVIRVGDAFYMASTSMHSMPGCPIMRSKDLQHWEIVNYVFDHLEDNAGHRLLDGKGIYGKGSWAPCLRHHNGLFYVCFSSNDARRFYVYRTDDIENGRWARSVFDELLHDPCLLFDDGRVFVIYGNGDIRIRELTADLTAFKPGGLDRLLFETDREGIALRCEGCHAFKLNGYYYLFFIEWPATGHRRRRQLVYRSRSLTGPYEKRIVLDDDAGYFNNGIAQGGLVDTPSGEWYAVLFQDHGAVGRVPWVVPVRWEDDWPVLGEGGRAPRAFATALPADDRARPIVADDEFDYEDNRLALEWQWNHRPDPRFWSVTARPGWLRLTAGHRADSVELAPNTLTQRTVGPACAFETILDASGLKSGDRAGMVALLHGYGTVGVHAGEDGRRSVAVCARGADGRDEIVEERPVAATVIRLKIAFDFVRNRDTATFWFAEEDGFWQPIGRPLKLKYTLDHFMGCRIGLYCHATTPAGGGHADFDYFRHEAGKWKEDDSA
jgi:beta-xylosidase